MANPLLTPGSVDPTATAEMVCQPGYATGRRPGRWAELKLKAAAMKRYGIARTPANWHACTLDHLVPIELGGMPGDPLNVWPQPRADAARKDHMEGSLHRAVCSGLLDLHAAQGQIVAAWSDPVSTERR